jgi:peptidoglycan/LPS O-acetylase OafA/YrhL
MWHFLDSFNRIFHPIHFIVMLALGLVNLWLWKAGALKVPRYVHSLAISSAALAVGCTIILIVLKDYEVIPYGATCVFAFPVFVYVFFVMLGGARRNQEHGQPNEADAHSRGVSSQELDRAVGVHSSEKEPKDA